MFLDHSKNFYWLGREGYNSQSTCAFTWTLYNSRISESVHDPITVTAMVLTDESEQVIMVYCDLLCST